MKDGSITEDLRGGYDVYKRLSKFSLIYKNIKIALV
jgi:hypothetical protein